MNIQIRNQVENLTKKITFPCSEETLQYFCNMLKLENTASTEVEIVSVLGFAPNALHELLKNRVVKLDELNLFAKCIDRLDKAELVTFYATAYALQQRELKDLINLSFNGECYNVVADFSDIDKLGRSLYLHEQGGVTEEEWRAVDGRKYVEDMIRNTPDPIMTPYGIVYRNSNELQKVYNGTCHPSYQWEENPITVCLNTTLDRDFLYLPCEQTEIDKALQRLHCTSLSDVEIEIENDTLPQNIADIVFQDTADIHELNEFAKTFKEIGDNEYEQLSELVEYTKVATTPDLKVLLDCYQEFELFGNIHSPTEYGVYMICDSGRFEYDPNLEEYIDFKGYGEEKIKHETGAFTQKGYILYHGYNREMEHILSNNLGMALKAEQQPTELKLYMSLAVTTYYEEDEYGRYKKSDNEENLPSAELCGYEDELADFIESCGRYIESDRGLMQYYDKHDTVNAKVKSYHFEFEQIGRVVYGVAIVELTAPLNAKELETLKSEIIGQASDGFGENLEQQDFGLGGRAVNIHLWNSDGNWSLQTAEELGMTEQKHEMGGMSK